jgi:hypothetical protein
VIEGGFIAPVVPEEQGEEAQTEDYDEIEYMPPTAIGASTAFSPCRSIPTPIVDRPYTLHFNVPDYKLAGMQLFDMTHSFLRDDATDCFYATEKQQIDDAGLLEASGFSSSPS